MGKEVEEYSLTYYWERGLSRYPAESWVRPRLDELIATLAKISAHEIITETLDPEAGFYVAYGLQTHPRLGRLDKR